LPIEALAARLEGGLLALASVGGRGIPTRQQTLHATLDWSHALLEEPERVLFHRLAVFMGGLTLEAAEAICGTHLLESTEVLDLLTRLVDKSLVTLEEREGEWRYR